MWEYIKFKMENAEFVPERDYTAWLLECFGMLLLAFVLISVIAVFYTVVCWRLFEKLGYRGWLGLVPFVNVFLLLKSLRMTLYYIPVILLLAATAVFDALYLSAGALTAELIVISIPVAIALLLIGIKLSHSLAKSFGKSFWYTLGIVVLPMIFIPVISLSRDSFFCKTY